MLPVFLNQIKAGKPLTITDLAMTRFMMSQTAAANLVIDTIDLAKGGEIFITKMPVIRLDRFGEALFQMAADANLVSAGKCFQDSVEIIGAR